MKRKKWRLYLARLLTVVMLVTSVFPAYADVNLDVPGIETVSDGETPSNATRVGAQSARQTGGNAEEKDDWEEEATPSDATPSNAFEFDKITGSQLYLNQGEIVEFEAYTEAVGVSWYYKEETENAEWTPLDGTDAPVTIVDYSKIETYAEDEIMLIDDVNVTSENSGKYNRIYQMQANKPGIYRVAPFWGNERLGDDKIRVEISETEIEEYVKYQNVLLNGSAVNDLEDVSMAEGDTLTVTVKTQMDFRRFHGYNWKVKNLDEEDGKNWIYRVMKKAWEDENPAEEPVSIKVVQGPKPSDAGGSPETHTYEITAKEAGNYRIKFEAQIWELIDDGDQSNRIDGSGIIVNITAVVSEASDYEIVDAKYDLLMQPGEVAQMLVKGPSAEALNALSEDALMVSCGTESNPPTVGWMKEAEEHDRYGFVRAFYVNAKSADPETYHIEIMGENAPISNTLEVEVAQLDETLEIYRVDADGSETLLSKQKGTEGFEPVSLTLSKGDSCDLVVQTSFDWLRFHQLKWKVMADNAAWSITKEGVTTDDGEGTCPIEMKANGIKGTSCGSYGMEEGLSGQEVSRTFTITAKEAGDYQFDFRLLYYRLIRSQENSSRAVLETMKVPLTIIPKLGFETSSISLVNGATVDLPITNLSSMGGHTVEPYVETSTQDAVVSLIQTDGGWTVTGNIAGTATIGLRVNGAPLAGAACEVSVRTAPTLNTEVQPAVLYEGKSLTIAGLVDAYKTVEDTITVSSSNGTIAEAVWNADQSGIDITAKGVGLADITVTLKVPGLEDQTLIIPVTVKALPVVTLDHTSLTLFQETTGELTLTLPEDLADAAVTWSVDDAAAASVTANDGNAVTATVTAAAVTEQKTVTVTATAVKGDLTASAKCTVTVNPNPTLTMNLSENKVAVGKDVTLTVTLHDVSGSAALNQLTLTAVPTGLVTIGNPTINGNTATYQLTGLKADSADLTASLAVAGMKDSAAITAAQTITVIKNTAAITMDETMELFVGKTGTLKLTLPDGYAEADVTAVVWQSDSEAVSAAADNNNKLQAVVTAKTAGSASVTAVVTSEKFETNTVTCAVRVHEIPTLTVTPAAETVSIGGDSVTVEVTLADTSEKAALADVTLSVEDTAQSDLVTITKGASADQTVSFTITGKKAGVVTLVASAPVDGLEESPITATAALKVEKGTAVLTMAETMSLFAGKNGSLNIALPVVFDANEVTDVSWTSDSANITVVQDESNPLQAKVTAANLASKETANIKAIVKSNQFTDAEVNCAVTGYPIPTLALEADKQGITYTEDGLTVKASVANLADGVTADLNSLTWTTSSPNGGSATVRLQEDWENGLYLVIGGNPGTVNLAAKMLVSVGNLTEEVTADCSVLVTMREKLKLVNGEDSDGSQLPLHLAMGETAKYEVKSVLDPNIWGEGLTWYVREGTVEQAGTEYAVTDPESPIQVTEASRNAFAAPEGTAEEVRGFLIEAKRPGNYVLQLRKTGKLDGEMAQTKWLTVEVQEEAPDKLVYQNIENEQLTIQEGETITVKVDTTIDWYRWNGLLWRVKDGNGTWTINDSKPMGESGDSPLKIEAVNDAFTMKAGQSNQTVTREFKVTAMKSGTYELQMRMRKWKIVNVEADGSQSQASQSAGKIAVSIIQPELNAVLTSNEIYAGRDTTAAIAFVNGTIGSGSLYWTTESADGGAVKIEKLADTEGYQYKVTGSIVGNVTLKANLKLPNGTILTVPAGTVKVNAVPKMTLNPVMITYPQSTNPFNLHVKLTNADMASTDISVSASSNAVALGTVAVDGNNAAVIPVTPLSEGTAVITVTANVAGYGEISSKSEVRITAPQEEGKSIIVTSAVVSDEADLEEKAAEVAKAVLESDEVKTVLSQVEEAVPEEKKAEIKSSIEQQVSEQAKAHNQNVEQSVAMLADVQDKFEVSMDAVAEEYQADTVITLKQEVIEVAIESKVTGVQADAGTATVESEIKKVVMEISLQDESGNDVVKENNTKIIVVPVVVPEGVSLNATTVRIIHDGNPMPDAEIEWKGNVRYFLVITTGFSPFEFEFVAEEEPEPEVKPDRPIYSGGSGGGGGSSKGVQSGTVMDDPVKGKVNSLTGIITGASNIRTEGYSSWYQQTDGTWKLMYANGTYAAGTMKQNPAGQTYEQPLWEMINGAWYAFRADGIALSGLFYDTDLAGWFYVDINKGMKTGWQLLDGKWYYFNPVSDGTKGRMLKGTKTPDGYVVDENGVWNGKEKEA